MTTQDIIKKICEKRPDIPNIEWWITQCQMPDNNFWLRGLLLDPETLKAVFGEKDTCFICGGQEVDAGKSFNGEITEYNPSCKKCGADWMDKAEFLEEGNYIPAWLYHGMRIVCLDTEEILPYYEQYL